MRKLLNFLILFTFLLIIIKPIYSYSIYKIVINNPNTVALTGFQVEINLSSISSYLQSINYDFKLCANPNGTVCFNYCFETSNGACKNYYSNVPKIWAKLDLSTGNNVFYIIPDTKNDAVNGSQVFDFYNDFSYSYSNSSTGNTYFTLPDGGKLIVYPSISGTNDAVWTVETTSNGLYIYLDDSVVGNGADNLALTYKLPTIYNNIVVESRFELVRSGYYSGSGFNFLVTANSSWYTATTVSSSIPINNYAAINYNTGHSGGYAWQNFLITANSTAYTIYGPSTTPNITKYIVGPITMRLDFKYGYFAKEYYLYNNSWVLVNTSNSTLPESGVSYLSIRLVSWVASWNKLYLYWVRVRKYADQDPTVVSIKKAFEMNIPNKKSTTYIYLVNNTLEIYNNFGNVTKFNIYWYLNNNIVNNYTISVPNNITNTTKQSIIILDNGVYNISSCIKQIILNNTIYPSNLCINYSIRAYIYNFHVNPNYKCYISPCPVKIRYRCGILNHIGVINSNVSYNTTSMICDNATRDVNVYLNFSKEVTDNKTVNVTFTLPISNKTLYNITKVYVHLYDLYKYWITNATYYNGKYYSSKPTIHYLARCGVLGKTTNLTVGVTDKHINATIPCNNKTVEVNYTVNETHEEVVNTMNKLYTWFGKLAVEPSSSTIVIDLLKPVLVPYLTTSLNKYGVLNLLVEDTMSPVVYCNISVGSMILAKNKLMETMKTYPFTSPLEYGINTFNITCRDLAGHVSNFSENLSIMPNLLANVQYKYPQVYYVGTIATVYIDVDLINTGSYALFQPTTYNIPFLYGYNVTVKDLTDGKIIFQKDKWSGAIPITVSNIPAGGHKEYEIKFDIPTVKILKEWQYFIIEIGKKYNVKELKLQSRSPYIMNTVYYTERIGDCKDFYKATVDGVKAPATCNYGYLRINLGSFAPNQVKDLKIYYYKQTPTVVKHNININTKGIMNQAKEFVNYVVISIRGTINEVISFLQELIHYLS